MDLSVGEPVKKRDTSELNESVAFSPNMINTMPIANSASPIPLFIMFLISCWDSPSGFAMFQTLVISCGCREPLGEYTPRYARQPL